MKTLTCILLFFSLGLVCQQTGQYTQYTFNKYGYNPAAAGTNINAGLEAIVGLRKQWIGFENSPASNFISANYTIKPERSYKRWHNVGIYLYQEKAGIFQNESFYASYTLHLPVTKRLNMSFGVFAGVRKFGIRKHYISPADPVYAKTYNSYFYAYPDFIPGIRMYSKTTFLDISVQQIFKTRQVQGDKQIGNKSILAPHLYISYGKKIFLENELTLVPALNLHSSFTAIPSLEANIMAYYKKRIGLGATIRNKDFISGIFQIRFFKNVTAGFAYDYSINRFNTFAPNSLEFMVGLTPMMATMGAERGKHSVAKCPNFDF
ncbi:MAG: type secretion system rane protein PorP/SprF [Bacteroidota bacterium]|jgi:type IX secretion system PorP/SprF family membrane protein|nr:type secretion system rane protein PorP/SprF [Bacteroidota bacterium]